MFASKSARGFFDISIDPAIPADAVEISVEVHAALLAGQGEGKEIGWDADGYPMLIEPPPPSLEVLAEIERAWRDVQLSATDGVVSRHRDEVEAATETTLTAEQYSELQAYRTALRRWPEAGEFPLVEHRPPSPAWLTSSIE